MFREDWGCLRNGIFLMLLLTIPLFWVRFGHWQPTAFFLVLLIFMTLMTFLSEQSPAGRKSEINKRITADFQARQQKAREANERQITQVEIEKKRRRREENRRYAKPFFPEFSAIKKPLGLAILSGGLWFIFLSQTMDTTVDVPGFPGKRVVNLELNSERQNYLILGGILLVSGIVLLNVPNKD